MAQCRCCGTTFAGRGRKARCDQCTDSRRCIECMRDGVTLPASSKCSWCYSTERECSQCGSTFLGTKSLCNRCRYSKEAPERKTYMEAWRDRTGHTERLRWRHLASKFNLTREAFAELVEAQGDRCAICGADEPGGKGSWHVDHDHSCCPGVYTCGGCIRGLLCHSCNLGLGAFRDNRETLMRAIGYLDAGHWTGNGCQQQKLM
jgi:hypothetical protein